MVFFLNVCILVFYSHIFSTETLTRHPFYPFTIPLLCFDLPLYTNIRISTHSIW